ncbi:MAG: ribokinase [Anaerolineae bacterium]|nr:ribokinase [Anaerolineae bacterium]MDW8172088.1 ribokinase [Anaerolineae bacterium]
MARIVVAGSLHMDIVVHAPRLPVQGETLAGRHWSLRVGGKGGNQAIQAAYQGAESIMIGRVGQDDFGQRLRAALTVAGVDIRHVRTDPSTGSGMSAAIIDERGDYGAVIVPGANLNLCRDDVAESGALDGADCLLLQYEIRLDHVASIAQLAHERGVRVILNAAPAYPAPAGLLDAVDVLVVNEVEAAMLLSQTVASVDEGLQAAQALSQSSKAAVVTLGGRGVAFCAAGETPQLVVAHQVAVVDMHGAGDAFIGALAVRLAEGDDLALAVRYANATGALAVSRQASSEGLKPILPDEVRALLQA